MMGMWLKERSPIEYEWNDECQDMNKISRKRYNFYP